MSLFWENKTKPCKRSNRPFTFIFSQYKSYPKRSKMINNHGICQGRRLFRFVFVFSILFQISIYQLIISSGRKVPKFRVILGDLKGTSYFPLRPQFSRGAKCYRRMTFNFLSKRFFDSLLHCYQYPVWNLQANRLKWPRKEQ